MKALSVLLYSLLTLPCMADTPHTIHDVNVSAGSWHGRLAMISAEQSGFFLKEDGTKLGSVYDFDMNAGQRLTYAFGFDDEHTDFNASYSLTLYEKGFTAKACVYVITAKGPAMPDILVESFNGANCTYQKGRQRGRDFFIS